jgi:hypothetical protein
MSGFDPVLLLIQRVRRRWRRLVLLQSATRAALALAAVLGCVLLLAAWTTGVPLLLGGLLVAAALTAAAAVAWAFWPSWEMPSDARVARFVEERDASLDDRLVSAAELATSAESQTAIGRLFADDVGRRAADVDPHAIIRPAVLRRAGVQAAAALLLVGAVAVAGRGTIREAVDALSLRLFPSRVVLQVTPGSVRLPSGSPLTIEARLMGNSAPVVAHVLRADAAAGVEPADWIPTDMASGSAGTFTLAIDAIDTPFKYRVAAGAARSDIFEVRVARPPRVARIDVEYSYPPALKMPPRLEEDTGDIYAPAGTDVRIRVRTDGEAATGSMTLADGRAIALTPESEGLVSAALRIVEDGSYRVALADREGMKNAGDTEYFIRVLEDRPPDVHVVRPARDRAVTRLEEVEIEAQAEDDHGVDRLELVYAIRGGAERAIPLRIDAGRTAVNGRHTLYLEDLDVRPGDFVSYYVRARDVARGKRPSEVRSDIFFLEVKPFEQEFALARSQAGGMGGGGTNRSLDDLVAAQKEIIVATWKLDRRSQAASGAQSEKDIRAVARAESELKTRVEQTSSSFRDSTMRDPRRSQPRPGTQSGQRPAQPEEDAMASAAIAMGRAVEALDRLRTGEALTPEMEALNHLLRAQADVKRREVMRQQAGGAGGQNRQAEDLSNLFDRELAREQQTNYETPTTTEQRDSSDSDLDSIRELARRQDEALRRQQELARRRDQMTPEGLKRELEQLTREQAELRRRAEELAQRLERQQGRAQSQQEAQRTQQGSQQNQQRAEQGRQGTRGNPQGAQRNQQGAGQNQQAAQQNQPGAGRSPQSAADRLREATRAMEAATGDLKRQDPRQASASGSRALQELQEAQQQMQRALPDERRRAMGDMQLEARQLADEQRAIAAEQGKAAGGEQGADTRRRLAGEQERLAERMRRLQNGLQEQANAPAEGGPGRRATDDRAAAEQTRNAAREASREIERQRLSERMQQSASEMRSGTGADSTGNSQARREQEDIARALDRLADRIGDAVAPGDEASRRIAEQLTRAQDLRDEIDRLTREVEQLAEQSGRGTPGDAARLRDEYNRRLRETRELLEQIGRDNPEVRNGGIGFTFEGQGMVLSAPGTEPFKQDFQRWEQLRKQVTLALDRAESELSRTLQVRDTRDRLAAGVDDQPPAGYQQQVDSYFKSLAGRKKPE